MYRSFALALLPLLAVPAAAAEPSPAAAELARKVAPYLDDGTVLVAHVDVARLDADAVADGLSAVTGVEGIQAARAHEDLARALEEFRRAGGKELFVVYSLADLVEGPFVVVPGRDLDSRALGRLLTPLVPNSGSAPLDDGVFVGPPTALARLRKAKPAAFPDLAAAFDDAGNVPVRLAVLAGPDTRRALEELLPTLPPELGGVSLSALARNVRFAALGVTFKPLRLRLAVACRDDRAAQATREDVHRLLGAVRKLSAGQPEAADLGRVLDLLEPETAADRLVRGLDERELSQALRPALARVRAAADRSRSANNLRQIGVALLAFHDAYGHFPAAAS